MSPQHEKISIKTIFIVFVTGSLGGLVPIFTKFALPEVNAFEIAFTRFFFTFLLLAPFLIGKIMKIQVSELLKLLILSLFFSGNVLFFVYGIQFTTSVSSQIMYLMTPSFVGILSWIYLRKSLSNNQIVSIVLGFLGGCILVFRSFDKNLILSVGTPMGNMLILFAVLSWSSYTVFSSRVSKRHNPLIQLIINSITVSAISSLFLLYFKLQVFNTYFHISIKAQGSLVWLVLGNTLLFFFLYQWIMKHTNPFITSLVAYLGPLASSVFGILLLGEQITIPLVISALLIVLSSFIGLKKS